MFADFTWKANGVLRHGCILAHGCAFLLLTGTKIMNKRIYKVIVRQAWRPDVKDQIFHFCSRYQVSELLSTINFNSESPDCVSDFHVELIIESDVSDY